MSEVGIAPDAPDVFLIIEVEPGESAALDHVVTAGHASPVDGIVPVVAVSKVE